jgi:hypothetical protein
MTPEQRRRNKKVALILVALVVALFVWTFFRGSVGFTK